MSALLRQIMKDSPSAYWPMTDASGTTVKDVSGNGRDLTWSSAPSDRTALLPGYAGGVVLAADKEATVAGASWQRPTAMTFEAWVKLSTPGGTIALVSNRAGVEGSGPTLYLNSDTTITFGTRGTSNSFSSIVSPATTYGDNTIHQVAGIWAFNGSDTVGYIYLDGVQIATGTLRGGTSIGTTDDTFRVAGENGSRRITGGIGHVALFPSDIGTAGLKSHYEAGRRGGVVFG